MRAEVVVASNRAAAGVYEDTTGPLIVELLRELGFTVDAPIVVPDGEPVGVAITTAAEGGARVVLTTGGTGLTPTDRTPEVTRALLDREIPGIAEAIRAYGVGAGGAYATPVGGHGSHLIGDLASSNALVVVPEEVTSVAAGEQVQVLRLDEEF